MPTIQWRRYLIVSIYSSGPALYSTHLTIKWRQRLSCWKAITYGLPLKSLPLFVTNWPQFGSFLKTRWDLVLGLLIKVRLKIDIGLTLYNITTERYTGWVYLLSGYSAPFIWSWPLQQGQSITTRSKIWMIHLNIQCTGWLPSILLNSFTLDISASKIDPWILRTNKSWSFCSFSTWL